MTDPDPTTDALLQRYKELALQDVNPDPGFSGRAAVRLAVEHAAALRAEVERLKALRCTCDDEEGHHKPDCILMLRDTVRGMTEELDAWTLNFGMSPASAANAWDRVKDKNESLLKDMQTMREAAAAAEAVREREREKARAQGWESGRDAAAKEAAEACDDERIVYQTRCSIEARVRALSRAPAPAQAGDGHEQGGVAQTARGQAEQPATGRDAGSSPAAPSTVGEAPPEQNHQMSEHIDERAVGRHEGLLMACSWLEAMEREAWKRRDKWLRSQEYDHAATSAAVAAELRLAAADIGRKAAAQMELRAAPQTGEEHEQPGADTPSPGDGPRGTAATGSPAREPDPPSSAASLLPAEGASTPREDAETLIGAARRMDWGQARAHGDAPCFHVEEDGRFCGRAIRWPGHQSGRAFHLFEPLYVAMTRLLRAAPQAAPGTPGKIEWRTGSEWEDVDGADGSTPIQPSVPAAPPAGRREEIEATLVAFAIELLDEAATVRAAQEGE